MLIRKPLYLMAEAEGTGEGSEGAGEAGGAGAAEKPGEQSDKTFTQADVDRIIAGRLSKYSDYDEIKQQVTELRPVREQFDAITKALGLKDEAPDPAKLTEQLTTEQANAREAQVQLAVYRSPAAKAADVDALLDSTSFRSTLKDVDPANAAAVAEAVDKFIEANPRFKVATSTVPPSFGGGPRPNADKPDPGPGIARLRDAYSSTTK